MSWRKTRKATLAHMQNAQKNKEIPQKVPAGNMLAASYYTGNGFNSVKTILNNNWNFMKYYFEII